MKIKQKKEIVTLGVPVKPTDLVGHYLSPQEWHEFLKQDDVIVVDTRNDYEYKIGTFKNAIDPKTETFRDFPQWVEQNLNDKKDKKIAMFCTGGIRCEKSTSLLLQQGFNEVYHLKGGILEYLKEIPAEESLWEGDCFVFDERIAVSHGLKESNVERCQPCGFPLTPEELQHQYYELGVSCPHCYAMRSDADRQRRRTKLVAQLPKSTSVKPPLAIKRTAKRGTKSLAKK